jgi:hypothetical protein
VDSPRSSLRLSSAVVIAVVAVLATALSAAARSPGARSTSYAYPDATRDAKAAPDVRQVTSFGLTPQFVSSAPLHSSGPAATAGSVTFTDPAGDAQTSAPDITSVAINGDPATGAITITVTATGYEPASADGLGRTVAVFLDTDKNSSSGSASGSEYELQTYNDASGRGWGVSHWDGSTFQSVPQSATMSFARSGNAFSWTLNTADLASAMGFAFWVAGVAYDTNNNIVGRDDAPDDGKWAYDIATEAPERTATTFLRPVISNALTVPARLTAGKRVTVSFRVTRSDTDKPLTAGKMSSEVSIAAKVLPHAQSFTNGIARASFVLPKIAKGKQLKVKVTIKAPSYKGKDGTYVDLATGQTGPIHTYYSGQSASKTVSFLVH